MDPLKNPFSPGAGFRPPELAGRAEIMKRANVLFGKTLNRTPEKSLLLTGLRGVGKTVLLSEMERIAKDEFGLFVMSIEAKGDHSLRSELTPIMQDVLFDMDRMAKIGGKAKNGFSVLKNFMAGLSISVGEVKLGFDINTVRQKDDEKTLEKDLPRVLETLLEIAKEQHKGIILFIDEIHYFKQNELKALLFSLHHSNKKQLPFAIVGAGLPVIYEQLGEAKTYAERMFRFFDVGALSFEDSKKAMKNPAKRMGADFSEPALHEIYEKSKGYPYFLQEWGYHAWEYAETSPIAKQVVDNVTPDVLANLNTSFFRVRFDRLTASEKQYLRAMAHIGGESVSSGQVAKALGKRVTDISLIRDTLVKKGMIYSPAFGQVAFTVPLFGDFMKRTIPRFVDKGRER